MRAPLLAALAGGVTCACTLLNSRDGLVGPPLAGDAGLDAANLSDGAPPPGTGADDGGRTGLDAEAGPPGIPDAAPSFDGPPSAADAGAADGGPTAIYSQLLSPLGITVHAGTLCWVQGDSLREVVCAPATAGTASQIAIVASQTNDALVQGAFDVARDDAYVYWSNGPKNQVVRKPIAGGVSAPYFTGDQQVSYIVLDGTNLWATDYVAGATSGNIVIGPSATSSSMLIYPGETQAAGLGVFSGSVYWGRASPGSVSGGPVGGNATITRVMTAGRVTGLAIDSAGTTYFLSDNQQMYRLVQAGSTPELLYDAGAPFGDSDLAADDTAIYWSEHDRGRIMRMAK